MKIKSNKIEYIITQTLDKKEVLLYEKNHNYYEINKFEYIKDKKIYIIIKDNLFNISGNSKLDWTIITKEKNKYKIYCKNYLMLKNLERL